jgi:hypothetical protein
MIKRKSISSHSPVKTSHFEYTSSLAHHSDSDRFLYPDIWSYLAGGSICKQVKRINIHINIFFIKYKTTAIQYSDLFIIEV